MASQWLRVRKINKKSIFGGNTVGRVIAINTNSIGTMFLNGKSYTYNKHLVGKVDIEKELNPEKKKVIYIRRT